MEKINSKKIIKFIIITISLAVGIILFTIYSYHSSNSSYDVDEAIEHAHTYLNKQILSDGKFIYRKHIDPHKYLEPEYNILRHMGSIYSLILMNDYKQGSMDFEKVGNSIQFIKDNSFEEKHGVRSYAVTGNLSSRLKSCPGNCPFIPVAPQSSI